MAPLETVLDAAPVCALPDASGPPTETYADDYLRAILAGTRTIAMVGASPDWRRPSYFAMMYLQRKGYRVIPVNPRAAGQSVRGEAVHADLGQIADPVDMVDVFRPAAEVPAIAERAIAIGAKVLWLQLGIRAPAAAARAEAAGLKVVMNRCPKIEHARLSGELGWNGINSGIVTSRFKRR